MNRLFRIGDFCFRLDCPDTLALPANFAQFAVEQGTPDYTYTLTLTDALDAPCGDVIARRADLVVCAGPDGESRLLGIKGQRQPYALYRDLPGARAEVQLDAHRIADLNFDPVFTSLFALERRLMERDALILHCAYVVDGEQAILFSAPSETGKSTQAGLWERYRGSRTVNGDRALLRRVAGRWTACGWPVCGTSEIFHLGDTPIRAIVMLRQSKTNTVERLTGVAAFTPLFAQITVNRWNGAFVQRAITDLEDLMAAVPVYQLSCTISRQAVDCLAQALGLPDGRTMP